MAQKLAAKKKKVRFLELVVERGKPSDKEWKEDNATPNILWYCDGDYYLFRNEAYLASLDAQRRGLFVLLPDRFEGPYSVTQQRSFNEWSSQAAVSARGLERLCSRKHCFQRKRARQRATQAVLHAQKVLNQGNRNHEMVEQLARISRVFSRDAKKFATMMGIADAHAARVVDETQQQQDLQQEVAVDESPRSLQKSKVEETPPQTYEMFPSAA